MEVRRVITEATKACAFVKVGRHGSVNGAAKDLGGGTPGR